MSTTDTDELTVAHAESLAMQREQDEAQAESRFRAVRAQLERSGQAVAVTQSQELTDWLRTRAQTDAAWGQWAMAVDRSQHRS